MKSLNCVPAPQPFWKKYLKVLPTNRVEESTEEITKCDALQKLSVELFDTAFRRSINSLDLPQTVINKLLYEDICEKKYEKQKGNEERMIVDNE